MYQKILSWALSNAARTQATLAFAICLIATLMIAVIGLAFNAPVSYAGYVGQFVAAVFFYARAKREIEITYLTGGTPLSSQQVFYRYGWMPWRNTVVLKEELIASSYSITIFTVLWAIISWLV